MNELGESQVLTLAEAALYLRVSPESLRAELELGKIEGIRIGNEWRIHRLALESRLRGFVTEQHQSRDIQIPSESATIKPLETTETKLPTQGWIARGVIEGEIRYYSAKSGSGMVCVLSNHVLPFTSKQLAIQTYVPQTGEIVHLELLQLINGIQYKIANIRPGPPPIAGMPSDSPAAANNVTDNWQAIYERAKASLLDGDADQARALMEEAIKKGGRASVYHSLASLEHKIGNGQRAYIVLREAINRYPKSVDLYYLYSRLEKSDQRLDQAVQILEQGLNQTPGNLILKRALIQTLLELSTQASLKQAEEVLLPLVEQNKIDLKDKLYQQYLTSVEHGSNGSNSSLTLHSLKTVPATPKAVLSQGTPEAQALYERAKELAVQGKMREARSSYSRAIRAGASVVIYTAFFILERDRGYLQDARRIIEEAKAKFPENAGLYSLHGQMERKSGNFQSAISSFEQGLVKKPVDSSLTWGLIQALFELGTEESLDRCGKLFETMERQGRLKSTNKNDPTYLSYIRLKQNKRASAVYKFFRAIDISAFVYLRSDRGTRDENVTDLVITIGDDQYDDLRESFGLSDSLIVRCFDRRPLADDIDQLRRFLRSFRNEPTIQMQGRRFQINSSNAFMVLPTIETDIRDRLLNILTENEEAIIPLDDSAFQNDDGSLRELRNLLSGYLGQRNLYESNDPVYGRPFFGRELAIKQIADDINRGQFLGIYGLRKMGKTSLVKQLQKVKLGSEAVAYVDLQSSHSLVTRNCAPLFWEIERELRRSLERLNPQIATLFRLAQYELFSDIPYDQEKLRLLFHEDLHSFLDALSDSEVNGVSQLVIILDEIEEMLPIDNRHGFTGHVEFFALLRGLAQTDRYRGLICNLVIAANPALSERAYWEEHENKVFVWYKSFFLPPLREDETSEMIRSLGRQMSVYWNDDATKAIFQETNGHPFLTRLLCGSIVEYHKHQRPLTIDRLLVEEQIPRFLRERSDVLDQITAMLQRHFPQEKEVLEQIALGVAPEVIPDDAIRHLLGYNLIEFNEVTHKYHVKLELLRRRIYQKRGISA